MSPQVDPAPDSVPLSLEALRVQEVERIAIVITARAQKLGSNPQEGQKYLKDLQMTLSLSTKISNWIEPPTAYRVQGNFYKFRLLPLEIQFRIWRFVLPAARILALRHEIDGQRYMKFGSLQI